MKNVFKKVVTGALTVAMLATSALGLASCSQTNYAENNTKIKLGVSGPLTGGAAVYGQAVKNSVELAVEEGWNSANMDVLVIVSADDGTGFFEVANTALCPVGQSREIEYIN